MSTPGRPFTLDIGPAEGTRRHWLRPAWYTVSTGPLEHGAPVPFTFRVAPDPDPARACARCGTDRTEGMGFADPDGFHCEPCHDLLHPYTRPPRWARMRLTWSIRLNNLYFRWCERSGRRVSQDAQLHAAQTELHALNDAKPSAGGV